MSDLAEFLKARLDEDERIAQAAGAGSWQLGCPHEHTTVKPASHDMCCRVEGDDITIYDEGGHSPEQAEHIARHDPARVRAEVAAKRELIEEIQGLESRIDGEWGLGSGYEDDESALRYFAAPYADHPDFDPAWRVEETT